MLFSVLSAVVILMMSFVAQISGWQVEWNWGTFFKPENFDEVEAAKTVASVTGRPILFPLGFGSERKCNPNHLLVAFQVGGFPISKIGWLLVAAFQMSPSGSFLHYELPIGETGGNMITSQHFPNKKAVEAAFNVKDSDFDIAQQNWTNYVNNPNPGCYALGFAASVGVQAWVAANAPTAAT